MFSQFEDMTPGLTASAPPGLGGAFEPSEWPYYPGQHPWELLSYPGPHHYPFLGYPGEFEQMRHERLNLNGKLDSKSKTKTKTKPPRKFELSEAAPEFIPPPPGLGASDLDFQPAVVDVGKLASPWLQLLLPPPGLLLPPGLEEGLAKAASTPCSISTAADSFGEDPGSTRSASSDECDAAPAGAHAPLPAAATAPLLAMLAAAPQLACVDIPRELRIESGTGGQVEVRWPVDARKLLGKDRQIISPSFELFPDVTCKLMIKPKPKGLSKGLASFQKARGCGSIELKIIEGAEKAKAFSFCLSIGSNDKKEAPRGPVQHSFASSSVCGLSRDEEDWDFSAATDPVTNTFLVSLVTGVYVS